MSKKPVVQGGVDNYLGKQPQVVAPRKWQSSPDKPATELAYITEAEKDLILKANLHGGLEKGPNMGPSGIMSLDSFGDIGGAGAAGVDTSASGAANDGAGFSGRGPGETQSDFDSRVRNQKEIIQKAEQRQAERLGYRERDNVVDMSRPGRFGLGGLKDLFSTALGFFNPALGLITRGLPDLFNRLRGKNVAQVDDEDTTLLDQVSPDLPFATSYLQGLQKNLSPIGTNYPGSNVGDFVNTTDDLISTGVVDGPYANFNDYLETGTGGITQTPQFDNSPYGRINDEDMVP